MRETFFIGTDEMRRPGQGTSFAFAFVFDKCEQTSVDGQISPVRKYQIFPIAYGQVQLNDK